MEFKVGDRVKYIVKNKDNKERLGQVGIVESISSSGGLYIKWADGTKGSITGGYIFDTSFKLLKAMPRKSPTHLVVWEVNGCGDPCKFFTNEKEAREEIKTLSELSNVKKDSIILVEIKSVQKVNVIKNVRLNQYKI